MATKGESVTITGGLATNADICKLFGLTDKTVRNKLSTLSPAMIQGSGKYYVLADVLPLIVKPKNIADYIRTMNFSELPKDLTKEFWAGQRSQQIFLKEAGDLWPTNKVVDLVGEAFKTIAMKVKLLGDQIDREATMTPEQRRLVEGMIDETLKGIANELQAKFKRRPEVKLPTEEDAQDDDAEEEEDDEQL